MRDVLLSDVPTIINEYASAVERVSNGVVLSGWINWKYDILGNSTPTGTGILSQTGLVLCQDANGNYHNLIIPALSQSALNPNATVPGAIAFPAISQNISDALIASGARAADGSPFQAGMIVVKAGG
jgi:hypothetical protein